MKVDFTDKVPQRFVGGLNRYFNDHIETGSFLRAVLENDLTLALCHADYYSGKELGWIVKGLMENAPSHAWGSKHAVAAWLSDETRALQRRLCEIRGDAA